jgi:hypothetical protein
MHGKCYRSQNLASKCPPYPHQQLGEKKSLRKVLNDAQRAMRVLLANTHLQLWRNECNAFLDRILMIDESWMHSFDPQMKTQNAEWCAPMLLRKKIARHSQGVLKIMPVMFFSRNGLVLDHPVPIGTTVNGPYYCSLLQDKVRPALRRKQPELMVHGSILLQDNTTPHRHHEVRNLVQCWGWEVCLDRTPGEAGSSP